MEKEFRTLRYFSFAILQVLIITSERSSNFQTTEGDKQLQTSGHLDGESKWGMWCDGVPSQFEAKNSFNRHCARIPRITIETKK